MFSLSPTSKPEKALHSIDIKRALLYYLDRTRSFCVDESVFICYAGPKKGMAPSLHPIARWVVICDRHQVPLWGLTNSSIIILHLLVVWGLCFLTFSLSNKLLDLKCLLIHLWAKTLWCVISFGEGDSFFALHQNLPSHYLQVNTVHRLVEFISLMSAFITVIYFTLLWINWKKCDVLNIWHKWEECLNLIKQDFLLLVTLQNYQFPWWAQSEKSTDSFHSSKLAVPFSPGELLLCQPINNIVTSLHQVICRTLVHVYCLVRCYSRTHTQALNSFLVVAKQFSEVDRQVGIQAVCRATRVGLLWVTE